MNIRDSNERWPDVYIVGAGRSGTTALHRILEQHPQLRVCDHKSPNYFASTIDQPAWETPVARQMARQWTVDPDTYRSLFAGARPDQMLVEASPVYLQATGIAQRIHAVNPAAKIIAVLRDPSDRAHAHYLGRRRDGIETAKTFGDWWARVRDIPLPRDVAFGHYIACGQYKHFLTQYLEMFGPAQVLVIFYDDFVSDPSAVVSRILKFIGVDDSVSIDVGIRANQSGEISNAILGRIWTSSVRLRTRLRRIVPESVRQATGRIFLSRLTRSALEPALRRHIIEVLRDDIEALAVLTKRDLTTWLE